MKCYLFIDDLRIPAPRPGYQLYVARTYEEAIRALEQQEFYNLLCTFAIIPPKGSFYR